MSRLNARSIVAALALAGALVAGVLFWWSHPSRQRQVGPRPIAREERSVVLITVDTTRADRLEPYGADNVATPHLARFADQGVTFEQAYAVAPITLVSHASILTGLYPPAHGVRNNGTHYAEEGLSTLAEELGDRGYRTGAFVSAAVLERRYGLDQGFEVYDDDLSTGRERHPRMVADRPAEAVIDSTLEWLGGVPEDEKFFVWAHFYDPHAAYSPPPPFRDQYRDRLYDGEIAYLDSQLGRLLAEPRFRDAVVMVIGDHGESLGEHGERTHALLAYDSTLHVPWLVRVPGAANGLRLAQPVSQVDLLPTVLDLVGMPWKNPINGRSLVPMMEGAEPAHASLYSETHLPFYTYGWAELAVLRRGEWKLIEAPTAELYNTRRDPRELSSLSNSEPSRTHDMRRDLSEFLAEWSEDDRDARLEMDLDAAERLRALGYLAVGSSVDVEGIERPDPKDVIDLHVDLEQARYFMGIALYDRAIESLRRVLGRDSSNLAALIDLAQAYTASDRLDEAQSAVEAALRLDPDYPRLYVQMAAIESLRDEGERALALVDRALEIDPRYLAAILQRARLLFSQGRRGEAVAVLDQALEQFPTDPGLASLYARRVEMADANLEAAETRLRAALDRDPFMPSLYQSLGDILSQTDREAEARTVFRAGLEKRPDDVGLHMRLGLMLARTGETAAEAHLRETLRLDGEPRPDVRLALGAWLADRGRLEEALAEYQRVLERRPDDPGARNNRAIALYRTDKLDEAEAELLDLVEAFPNHGDAANNLAVIYLAQRRWAAAERYARKTLDLLPQAHEGWNNLGIALEEQGAIQKAEEAYRKALEIEPDYWQASNNLGVALGKQGRWTEAAASFEAALTRMPRHPEVHLELGKIYAEHLPDSARARAHLNAFLAAVPGDPRAAEVRRQVEALPPS